MSRLALIPPHLIDMPLIGDTRVVPVQSPYADPLAISADLGLYNADFTSWTGAGDCAEQELTPNTNYDFTTYYDDEEFWGLTTSGNSMTVTRNGINAQGQFSQIASYALDINTIFTALNPGYANYWNLSSYTSVSQAILRLTKTRVVLFTGALNNTDGNGYHYACAITLDLVGSSLVPFDFQWNAISQYGTSANDFFGPSLAKLSDVRFAVEWTSWGNVSYLTHGLQYNVATKGVQSFRNHVIANDGNADTGQFKLHKFGAGRLLRHGVPTYTSNSPTNSLKSNISVDIFNGTDSSDAAPSIGTELAPITDALSNQGTGVARRLLLPLTTALVAHYQPSSRALNLFNITPSTATLLSSLSLASLFAATPVEHVMAMTRVSATSFLIVTAGKADATKAVTSLIQVNPVDNTMAIVGSVQNYTIAPYYSGGPQPDTYHHDYQGLVLPGNRTLMNSKRYTANQVACTSFVKLLRGDR